MKQDESSQVISDKELELVKLYRTLGADARQYLMSHARWLQVPWDSKPGKATGVGSPVNVKSYEMEKQ